MRRYRNSPFGVSLSERLERLASGETPTGRSYVAGQHSGTGTLATAERAWQPKHARKA